VKNVGAKDVLDVENILFINYGNYFLDEAIQRGVADGYAVGTHGAVFADLDNDQDFDLFSTTTYDPNYQISPAHNHIYRNDSLGNFEDITSSIHPSQDTDTASRGVAAVDFDGDGDVDLYFSNPKPVPGYGSRVPFPPEKLKNFYMNNGDGTFTNEYRGIKWTSFVQGVEAIDIDGDGDIDIAEAKPSGPSTIYLSDGTGHFYNAGAEMGLPQTLNQGDNGMTFADVDNDGDLDLAVIGGGRVDLFRNSDNSFTKYQTIDYNGRNKGFHVSFGDFDHDGNLDLFLSGENVYKNDGQGIFYLILTDTSGLKASLSTRDCRGSALGDFDDDGDLDIYVSAKRGYNIFFKNDLNNSNWIQVDVIDNTGGSGGLGTKLDLYLAGHLGQIQYLKGHREIHGEYGYLGQDMPTAHFGVSASDRYDLKITFLNGEERIIRNIAPGQKIQVAYILAPLNFSGAREENKALFYRESMISLTWEANPENRNILKYRIYMFDEEGRRTLLDEVDADTFSYLARGLEKDKSYRFALTAIDHQDAEGEAAYTLVD
jgi:hypothetical protein